MKKTIYLIFGLLITLSSCKDEDANTSTPPSIEIQELVWNGRDNTTTTDAFTLNFSYQDEDGNFGIPNNLKGVNPFHQYESNGAVNLFYYNVYVDVLKKSGNTFTPIGFAILKTLPPPHEIPTGGVDNVSVVTSTSSTATMSLDFDLNLTNLSLATGDEIQVELYIADRDLNLSNVLRSNTITLP